MIEWSRSLVWCKLLRDQNWTNENIRNEKNISQVIAEILVVTYENPLETVPNSPPPLIQAVIPTSKSKKH